MLGSSLAALALLLAHASNTVTEEHDNQKDEDLLDLMVRIVDSPEEWERVHRVLSQLGAEKDVYYSKTEKTNPKYYTTVAGGVLNKPRVTQADVRAIQHKSVFDAKGAQIKDVTLHQDKESYSTSTIVSEIFNDQVVDTGWPDFEETFGELRKHRKSFEYNHIPETDWFEDDWHDFKTAHQLETFKTIYRSVSFKPVERNISTQKNSKSSSSFGPRIGFATAEQKVTDKSEPFILRLMNIKRFPRPLTDSRIGFQEPNIAKLSRSHDKVSLKSKTAALTNSHSSKYLTRRNNDSTIVAGEGFSLDQPMYNLTESRSSRPEFQYHRVTSSPQRRGGGAFIAVSVAKQKAPEASAGTTKSSLRHRTEDQLTSPKQDKRKHRSKPMSHYHHHGKGRRRHLH